MKGRRCMVGPATTFWKNKRVFITGHTGFKGVWLSLWLQSKGAAVFGYSTSSRDTSTKEPAVSMESFRGDICDLEMLQKAMHAAAPDIVFHMAAQPLVRRAFHDPVATYRTNVVGTATLLECVRRTPSVHAVVVVTTDKCYENMDWDWAYREADRLGGSDPYSTSKACMELVVGAYHDSFFSPDRHAEHGVGIASARAGNVIGGGDWAQDRLIPDLMRSFAAGHRVTLRNPRAMRPWQYVLEALRGYLLLAERLYEEGSQYGGAWNFGPNPTDIRPVEWIVSRLAASWGTEAEWELQPGEHPQETAMLKLDCSKAASELQWRPVLHLAEALEMTVDWYRHFYAGNNPRQKYLEQIATYSAKVTRAPEIVSPALSKA
jgi:CDP-glucose 4,6-dehydratase